MSNKHLTEEELQIIAGGAQAEKAQVEHLSKCGKCTESLKLYKMISSSLDADPKYEATRLTAELIIKKLNKRRFAFLFSSKFDIYGIIFLFLTAVATSLIFTDFIPSLKSVNLSFILKVFTENKLLKSTFNIISSHSQVFIYLPFIILTLLITLFFEKIFNSFRHRINNT